MKSFAKLVEGIADVEMALSMHSAAGASITAGRGWGCGGIMGFALELDYRASSKRNKSLRMKETDSFHLLKWHCCCCYYCCCW